MSIESVLKVAAISVPVVLFAVKFLYDAREKSRERRKPHLEAVRQAAIQFVRTVSSSGVGNALIAHYNCSTRDLRMYYPNKIKKYLDLLYKKAIALDRAQTREKWGEDHERAVNEKSELEDWFSLQLAEIDRRWKKYR